MLVLPLDRQESFLACSGVVVVADSIPLGASVVDRSYVIIGPIS
jgi:hypothetical protein